MARAVRRTHDRRREASPSSGVALVVWVLVAALLGLALWQIDRPPWDAWRAWDWERVSAALGGSQLTDSDVVTLAATIAWLALSYLVLTLCLRLLLAVADTVTGGAAWARTALALTNLITLPAVRRAVDGAVAGTLVVASWLPAPQRLAGAAPAPTAAVVPAPSLPRHLPQEAIGGQAANEPALERTQLSIEYTVVRGDYLWDIARRLYGDGTRFIEIFEANRGRVMTNGETFSDPRLIRTGWVLHVRLPAANVSVEDERASYRVRRGDHLWGIAERFLGDGFRWVEIWERNGGSEMAGGARFTDPNLIHPGWLLALPVTVTEAAPPARAEPAPAEARSDPAAPAASPPAAQPLIETDADAVDADDDSGGGWGWDWPSMPREVLVTAAGFVVIGGTALFVRRLHQAGVLALPRRGNHAADPPGDAGRVALATRALTAALADHGFAESLPLLVTESGRRLAFTVSCPPGDADALVAARYDLARSLACEVDGEVVGLTRVMLRLSGFQRLAAMLGSESDSPTALAVPVGADERGIVYLNIAAAGSVALAGTASERRGLLKSWLATLSTVLDPDELVLRLESAAAQLLGAEGELPHVPLADASEAVELAEELDELVESRQAMGRHHPVVVIADRGTAGADRFESVRRYGSKVGVYVIVSGETPSLEGDSFGASIALGAPGDESDDGEEGAAAQGALALTLGRDEPQLLEPVHVRRDSSPRWKESVEVATFEPPFGGLPVDPPPTGDAEAPADAEVDESQPVPTVALEPDSSPDLPKPRESDAPPQGGALEADGVSEAVGAAGALGFDEGRKAKDIPLHGTTREVVGPLEGTAAGANAGAAWETDEVLTSGEREAEPSEPRDETGQEKERALQAPEAVGLSTTEAARQGALIPQEDFALGSDTNDAAAPIFEVRCLGRFEVRLGETVISSWSPEKSRELVGFLAAHGGDSVAREIVADALWPGYPWDESVRHLIANAASGVRAALRKAAGKPDLQPLTLARQRLHLQRSLFRTDLDALESALRRAASLPDGEALAEYERAFDLYSGDFLEGELYSWVGDYRTEHGERMLSAARRGVAIAEQLDEPERAMRFHRLILEREPTDEAAARGVMRYLAASGEGNAARKVYRALTESLQTELDDPRAAPGAETRALYAQLLDIEASH